MQLDTDLRQTLWNARHWDKVLCDRAAALRDRPRAAELAAPARALAEALEGVVLDRRHAIEMYLLASKVAGGDPASLSRARALAREIGQIELAARIAGLEHKRTGAPATALAEGEAWLDAGLPDRAIQPLLAAARARPDDAAAARGLAAARREWADVRGEIARLEAEAAGGADAGAASLDYLHAARIARMLGEPERARDLVLKSFSRDPLSDAAYALCELAYVEAGDWNGLLEVYRRRAGAVATTREVVEALRRGATRMSVGDGAPALAVTVAVRALGYAYDEGVADIPGHAAMLDIICRHYIRARAADRMLPVIDRGLEAGLPEDDAVALAIVGLDVAWSHMGSARAAQRYAAWVEPRAPDNPVLAEYRRGGGVPASGAGLGADPAPPDALELADEPQGSDPRPRSPIPAQATPPAPELDDMIEIDSDDLVELDDEESEASIDVSAIADPGEGSTDATGPIRVLTETPPAEPEGAADTAGPRAAAEAAKPAKLAKPAKPAKSAEPAPRRPADKPGGAPGAGVSLIPGNAKRALEDIVRAPSSPPGKEAEKRADERVAVPADVHISISANVVLGGAGGARGVTRDLSRTGAFVVTDASLPAGASFEMRLSLPSEAGLGTSVHTLRARVVREEPGVGYGVRFDEPAPEYERALAELERRQRG